MLGFLIKKNFFDLWDNLFHIILMNLGFLVSLTVPVFLPRLIPGNFLPIALPDQESISAAFFILLFLWIFWCCIYFSGIALSVKTISDYGTFGFADFWKNLKAGLPAGLLMGFIVFILCGMAAAIFLYLRVFTNWQFEIRLLLASVIFWTLVVSILSFQFFFAIRARLDTNPKKIIKKCFIIFFDNPGFAIFTFLHTILTMVLSFVFALLIPGPAGIILFMDEALRLRLMKYDWLEANPDPEPSRKRRQIPWDAILIDEREKTGTRTLKNFIFPWKD